MPPPARPGLPGRPPFQRPVVRGGRTGRVGCGAPEPAARAWHTRTRVALPGPSSAPWPPRRGSGPSDPVQGPEAVSLLRLPFPQLRESSARDGRQGHRRPVGSPLRMVRPGERCGRAKAQSRAARTAEVPVAPDGAVSRERATTASARAGAEATAVPVRWLGQRRVPRDPAGPAVRTGVGRKRDRVGHPAAVGAVRCGCDAAGEVGVVATCEAAEGQS